MMKQCKVLWWSNGANFEEKVVHFRNGQWLPKTLLKKYWFGKRSKRKTKAKQMTDEKLNQKVPFYFLAQDSLGAFPKDWWICDHATGGGLDWRKLKWQMQSIAGGPTVLVFRRFGFGFRRFGDWFPWVFVGATVWATVWVLVFRWPKQGSARLFVVFCLAKGGWRNQWTPEPLKSSDHCVGFDVSDKPRRTKRGDIVKWCLFEVIWKAIWKAQSEARKEKCHGSPTRKQSNKNQTSNSLKSLQQAFSLQLQGGIQVSLVSRRRHIWNCSSSATSCGGRGFWCQESFFQEWSWMMFGVVASLWGFFPSV